MPSVAIETSVYRMADRLLQGRLADRLITLRGEGLSFEDISRRLYADAGIEVTGGTLRIWHRELTGEPEAASA